MHSKAVGFLLFLALLISLPDMSSAQTATASMQTGYVKLLPTSSSLSPAGMAIFGLRNNGVLISEAGVPSSPLIQSGRVFVEVDGLTKTGIAFANPTNDETTVTFYFTNGQGNDFGAGSVTILPNHQIAAFLTESPFNLSSPLVGTFTFNSSGPIAAIALRSFVNERSEVLMTTMPVSPLTDGFGGNTLLFPHFADNGNWTTEVVMINSGDTPISGVAQFYSQGTKVATLLMKVIVNGVSNSSFNYSVPPRSASRLVAQPAKYGTEIGSIRILPAPSSAAPSSLAVVSRQAGGFTVSTASVAAIPAAKTLRMYVESAGIFGQLQSVQTGVSLSNPTSSRVTVQMELKGLDGISTGLTASLDIIAGGQISKFLLDLFPQLSSTFKGVLKLSAPASVAISSLRGRYNERGDLLVTATPPYDDMQQQPSEIYFPHVINGGGYSTQLVLFSTGSAQSGSLWLLTQDGLPLQGVGVSTQ